MISGLKSLCVPTPLNCWKRWASMFTMTRPDRCWPLPHSPRFAGKPKQNLRTTTLGLSTDEFFKDIQIGEMGLLTADLSLDEMVSQL